MRHLNFIHLIKFTVIVAIFGATGCNSDAFARKRINKHTSPSPSPSPSPSSTSSWVKCADEYGTCTFTGTRRVLYGRSTTSQYVIKTFTSSVKCDNATFGDPAPTYAKSCWYESTTSSSTPTPTPTSPTPTPAPSASPLPGTKGMSIGPTISSFKASGPIVAVSGQTISGLWITNPSGPCIKINGVDNVTIHDNRIGPCGPDAQGSGINAYDTQNLNVRNNFFENVATGLYVTQSTGGVVFERNYATQIRGPMPRGQMVQLNAVNGPGIKIQCNVSNQKVGGYVTGPEDHINFYKSGGTQASPAYVQYNKLRGGGPSLSGGGIVIGDDGGQWTTVQDNIAIDPGQYGMAIANGTFQRLLRNRVYSPTALAWNNNGFFIWNQYPTKPCSDTEIRDNRVFYRHRDGYLNAGWNGGGCGTPSGWGENKWTDFTLTADMWDEIFDACR